MNDYTNENLLVSELSSYIDLRLPCWLWDERVLKVRGQQLSFMMPYQKRRGLGTGTWGGGVDPGWSKNNDLSNNSHCPQKSGSNVQYYGLRMSRSMNNWEDFKTTRTSATPEICENRRLKLT